jgi:DnaK suppressor protein
MRFSKEELEKYRQRLNALKGQVTHVLEGNSQEIKRPDEATGYSQHQADQGTDDFDRQLSLELTHNDFSILRQIDRALEKINDETYGVCDITGKEIPMARLDAVPYATMTVQAQEDFEKGLIGE